MTIDIVTDARLIARLTKAAKRKLTPAENRAQRISFVYGNLPAESQMTKAEVERLLVNMDERVGK